MLPGDCRNAWLLAWQSGAREKRDAWREEEPRDEKSNEATRAMDARPWEQQAAADNTTTESSRNPGNECPPPGSNSSCCESIIVSCIVECHVFVVV